MTHTRTRRPRLTLAFAGSLVVVGFGAVPAHADVTAVSGGAVGYSLTVSLFGGPPNVQGPAPAVTLPASGAAVPFTAVVPSTNVVVGPATFFSSGVITVSTEGTTGPAGAVTSSSSITNVNASGLEELTAAGLSSTCSATESGSTASTTVTNGLLMTDNGDDDPTNAIPDHEPVTVPVPTNPAPNYTVLGHVHIGNTTDDHRHVFNEQTINPDGSITVNAYHLSLLGPTAVGDLVVGQSRCGVTSTADTTPPQTTIDSGPTGTIAVDSASFGFSSSEPDSTFACKLDGPGGTIGTPTACTTPQGYSSLAEGSYTFSVQATDAAGNTDGSPDTRSFTVDLPEPPDTTPPETTIDSGPSGTISSAATASFTFSSSEAGSTFECRLDGPGAVTGTFGACTSPESYSGLAVGTFTFSVRATDLAGNSDGSPDTRSFTVTTGADLSIELTDSPDPVPIRGDLTYTMTVSNAGPAQAVGAFATLVLPKGMRFIAAPGATCAPVRGKINAVRCELGTLADQATTSVTILVSTGPKPVPVATSTATVGSSTADPVPGNNSDSESTVIVK